MPLGKDKIRSTVILPKDLWKRVKKYAVEHDMNVYEVVEEALRRYLGDA